MTREEAIKVLLQHSEHWKRLLIENICSKEEGLQTVEALEMAIKSLESKTDEENIHREREQAYMQGYEDACKKYRQEPKIGHWIEDEYEMKVWCSECGEENDNCLKYCPNCGVKMQELEE